MALNTPYKRINPNSINYAAMGQKDPWFALGYALGEGYWNNYNARGEAKATETARQMLAEKTGDSAGVLSNDDLINKYARPDKKQQAINAAVQLPELKPLSKDKDGESKGSAGAGQPTFDHALLKWGYTQDKYKDSPNPVGDSVAAQKLLNGTEIALNSANMGAFNENEFKLALMDRLTKEGRTPQQREAAWAAIQPMIANKKAEYNNKVVDQLYGLYKQAEGVGDTASAEKFLMQINQINPNIGKFLSDGRITAKDRWKADQALRVAEARAGRGKGGKGKGYFINPTNEDDLKLAQDIVKNPDAYTEDQVRKAKRKIDYSQRWGIEGLNLSDAYEVSKYFDYVRDNSSTDLEATRILAEDGFIAKHPYAKELLHQEGFYMPSDFGEGGAWMSSGETDDYNLPSEEVGVFTPIEDKPKTKLTVETRKDSVVQAGKELSTKYSQDNGLWNVAKLSADWDAERKKK